MPNLSHLIRLMNHYGRNKEWNNVEPLCAQILEQLSSKTLDTSNRSWIGKKPSDLLKDFGQTTFTARHGQVITIKVESDEEKFRNSFGNLFKIDLSQRGHMTIADLITNHWTISFHNQESLVAFKDEHENENFVAPKESTSFLVRLKSAEGTPPTWSVEELTKSRAAQIAYIFSRRAQSQVASMLSLYKEGPILSDLGTDKILQAARYYFWSLTLNPDNAWTWAHLGETYRDIANGWPGSTKTLTMPNTRVARYIIAIECYRRSIKIYEGPNRVNIDNQSSFWARAHLGAALINARGFITTGHANDLSDLPEVLRERIEGWYPLVPPTPPTPPTPPIDTMLGEALVSLAKAQQLSGNYYPWAQAYYGFGLSLVGLEDDNLERGHSRALAGSVSVVDATYLQPELVVAEFEAGELYVNGYFQFGLLYLYSKHKLPRRRRLAWGYTCMGMMNLFKFHFVPGLQALCGFQLLVNIACANNLPGNNEETKGKTNNPMGDLFPGYSGCALNLKVLGVEIPAEPIDCSVELESLIRKILDDAVPLVVGPFLEQVRPKEGGLGSADLSSSIRMSLIQTIFILENFSYVLTNEDLKERIFQEQEKIAAALGITYSPPIDLGLETLMGSKFVFFHAGKPSYTMSKTIGLLS